MRYSRAQGATMNSPGLTALTVVPGLLLICFEMSLLMAFAPTPRKLRPLPLHNRPVTGLQTREFLTSSSSSSSKTTGYLKAETNGSKNIDDGQQQQTEDNDIDDDDDDPLEGMDPKRKENLFQCLLRDLQIEGVPLLDCDVDDVSTLQVAIWTLMATLSTEEVAQKVCLVMEDISIDALKNFVNDFTTMTTTTTDRLQRTKLLLPELQRFNIELVGKGVGPAIVIETTTNITTSDATPFNAPYPEDEVSSAQEAFFRLEAEEEDATTTAYRYCGCDEICHIMSSFWNCICELKVTPNDDDLSSIVLSLPAFSVIRGKGVEEQHDEEDGHATFLAVTELINRSLCLIRGNDLFEIQYLYPDNEDYDDDDHKRRRQQPPFPSVVIKRKKSLR